MSSTRSQPNPPQLRTQQSHTQSESPLTLCYFACVGILISYVLFPFVLFRYLDGSHCCDEICCCLGKSDVKINGYMYMMIIFDLDNI